MPRSDRWRLLLDGGAPGSRNMAVDDALLASASLNESEPWSHTLRLYWFEPPALSIGSFQPIADVNLAACAMAGIDIVRRPTGGRAVLHDGCITYSISGRTDGPLFEGGIRDGYRRISEALGQAVRALGEVHAAPAQPAARTPATPSCFDSAGPYELLVDGKKIVGSAQVRRGLAALQHGSLLLSPSCVPVADLLTPRRGREPVEGMNVDGPTTLSSTLGRMIGRPEAADALTMAFAHTFGAIIEPGRLSDEESERSRTGEGRYSSTEWTIAR